MFGVSAIGGVIWLNYAYPLPSTHAQQTRQVGRKHYVTLLSAYVKARITCAVLCCAVLANMNLCAPAARAEIKAHRCMLCCAVQATFQSGVLA